MKRRTYQTGTAHQRCGTVYQQVQAVHEFDGTSPTRLNDLVRNVLVEEPDKSDRKYRQSIYTVMMCWEFCQN